jgi:hypothetical protein
MESKVYQASGSREAGNEHQDLRLADGPSFSHLAVASNSVPSLSFSVHMTRSGHPIELLIPLQVAVPVQCDEVMLSYRCYSQSKRVGKAGGTHGALRGDKREEEVGGRAGRGIGCNLSCYVHIHIQTAYSTSSLGLVKRRASCCSWGALG